MDKRTLININSTSINVWCLLEFVEVVGPVKGENCFESCIRIDINYNWSRQWRSKIEICH